MKSKRELKLEQFYKDQLPDSWLNHQWKDRLILKQFMSYLNLFLQITSKSDEIKKLLDSLHELTKYLDDGFLVDFPSFVENKAMPSSEDDYVDVICLAKVINIFGLDIDADIDLKEDFGFEEEIEVMMQEEQEQKPNEDEQLNAAYIVNRVSQSISKVTLETRLILAIDYFQNYGFDGLDFIISDSNQSVLDFYLSAVAIVDILESFSVDEEANALLPDQLSDSEQLTILQTLSNSSFYLFNYLLTNSFLLTSEEIQSLFKQYASEQNQAAAFKGHEKTHQFNHDVAKTFNEDFLKLGKRTANYVANHEKFKEHCTKIAKGLNVTFAPSNSTRRINAILSRFKKGEIELQDSYYHKQYYMGDTRVADLINRRDR